MLYLKRRLLAIAVLAAMATTCTVAISPAIAQPRQVEKIPTATGYGGSVSTVDPEASAAAMSILRKGGNAVDAAVAAAATLGVTEPYSAGIGGGGYFVYYNAKTGKVRTIDGRETSPSAMPTDAFNDPATGAPYNFTPELVTSGVAVGVPGTPATWDRALKRWGTMSLSQTLKPAIKVAKAGFVVDQTFRDQTLENKLRFNTFTSTQDLFLPGGDAPAVGSIFKNPDIAKTYSLLAKKGTDAFYTGQVAQDIVDSVTRPPLSGDTDLPVPVGFMSTDDLAAYKSIDRAPTHVSYRGLDVYGMAPSSSGGTTVGEALNILEGYDLKSMPTEEVLHHYVEAASLAFADRAAYVADPAFVNIPQKALTDQLFGQERACNIDSATAGTKPFAPGDVTSYDGKCPTSTVASGDETDTENISTTNLTVADRWGNVVEYTLTIEQTGGSGIVVPERGFLLNNELTDFSPTGPNRIEPNKRPRSSMSPTIVLKDGAPYLALGSPGGSTIITTVLQTLVNRVDRGMNISQAVAAPRAAPWNGPSVTAEPEFIEQYASKLKLFGHDFYPSGDSFTAEAEIGAATAIEFGPNGLQTAVAEPTRRGGGSALVLKPAK
ncbi:gamma-glutamyltransferase [Glutamicibacter sp. JC586]|uniref:gamma-glutamyltransferase n=1 Tax=Glutamicibacter sp. JC586 TaxID=2590552 RepID=UPI0013580BC6|nr:gamma-glutamyltransferase [Glutamicibacter sp. JC586]